MLRDQFGVSDQLRNQDHTLVESKIINKERERENKSDGIIV